MNAGWPTARFVTLSLATRDAVSRVTARRKRSSPGAGWSRVALRWRRRRRCVSRALSGGTTVATHANWFLQFHLHFNERTTRLVSRGISDPPRLATVHDARTQFRQRYVTFTRATGVASMLARRLHPAAPALVSAGVRSSRTLPAPADEPPRVLRLHRSERPRDRVRGEAGRPGVDTGIARHGARLEGAALIELSRPLRWREAPALRRSTRPADRSLPAAAAKAPRLLQRPADLIWRTSPRADAVVANRNAHAAGSVSARPVPVAVQSTTNTSTVEARKDRPAVLSASSVDPRLLDRLTDDVIRQVERRIRIDRERRGL